MTDTKTTWAAAIKWFLILGIMFIAGTSLVGQAKASHPHWCSLNTTVENHLRDGYGEAPKHDGTSGPNQMRVFVSKKGGWSIVYTTPKGVSCMMLSGSDWSDVPWLPGKRG